MNPPAPGPPPGPVPGRAWDEFGLPGQVVEQLRRLLDEVTMHGEIPHKDGWIPCGICTELIALDDYLQARCWTDPNGITVAAHGHCLTRLGEAELDLGS